MRGKLSYISLSQCHISIKYRNDWVKPCNYAPVWKPPHKMILNLLGILHCSVFFWYVLFSMPYTRPHTITHHFTSKSCMDMESGAICSVHLPFVCLSTVPRSACGQENALQMPYICTDIHGSAAGWRAYLLLFTGRSFIHTPLWRWIIHISSFHVTHKQLIGGRVHACIVLVMDVVTDVY